MPEKIDTNLDKNHKSRWTEWQGIREIIQNALDESDTIRSNSLYSYGLSDKIDFYIDNTNRLIIQDYGRGMPIEAFIMGWGTKHEEETTGLRGMFGVGLLEGILTLTRLGYDIVVESNPQIHLINPNVNETEPPYTISGFRFEKRGILAEVLVADLYRNMSTINKGTRIIISHSNPEKVKYLYDLATDRIVGIPGSKLKEFEINPNVGSIILKYDKQAGYVFDSCRAFVKGIYIQNITSIYSYNVYSNDALGGSERDKIDSYSFRSSVSHIIGGFNDYNTIYNFLKEICSSTGENLIEKDVYYLNFYKCSLWCDAFKSLFGDAVILDAPFHVNILNDLNIPFVNTEQYGIDGSFWDSLAFCGIDTSDEYVKASITIKKANPTDKQLLNLKFALKLALKILLKHKLTDEEFNRHYEAWKNRIFDKIYVRGEDKTNIILGMIEGGTIFPTEERPDFGCYINIKQLNDMYTTFGTLIHEYGHVYDPRIPHSGSKDYDRVFEDYLEYALRETLIFSNNVTVQLLTEDKIKALANAIDYKYRHELEPQGIVFIYSAQFG